MTRKLTLAAFVVLLGGPTIAQETTASTGLRWLKGNTHTHTSNSDGDSSPSIVAHWYRNHGYDFLSLTDHNKLTEVVELQREMDEANARENRKPFLLIPGEEVSSNFNDAGKRTPIHVCGIDTQTTVGGQKGATKRQVLQNALDAIEAAGGLPSVNHPNFGWALTPEDLAAINNLRHFEIYNGHPSVNDAGGGGVPSTEGIWDILLSRGRMYYGVAVDDAHHYKRFARDQANPGRGWIVVRAAELSGAAITRAFREGEFYSSTGVELDDVTTTKGEALALRIRPNRDEKFRTEFIGRDGKVLKTDESMSPSYHLQPEDMYVRARVTSSNRETAWTQPVFGVSPQ